MLYPVQELETKLSFSARTMNGFYYKATHQAHVFFFFFLAECFKVSFFLIFNTFLLDVFFIFIANFTPPKTPLSHTLSLYSLTHPLPFSCPCILLHWGFKLSWDQGPLLSLMSHKTILCYIHNWSHGSLHVYTLFGGLERESSEGTGWFTLLFLLWGCNTLQQLGFFL